LRYVSTGCETLDRMMGGGLLSGAVNLVYGDPGAGKTTLIMQTILSTMLTEEDGCFYYLDTEKGYLQERLEVMAQAFGLTPESVNKRVKSYRSTSLSDQHKKIIHTWEEDIKASGSPPLLFCVDSFVNHYHKDLLASSQSFLAAKARELQGRLAYQAGKLLDLADRYDAPAILVSWTKSAAGRAFQERARKKMWESGELVDVELGLGAKRYDVVGGSHLEYVSKTINRLMILGDDRRVAILEKHIARPVPKLVLLEMSDRGLEPSDDKVHELDAYYQRLIEEESPDRKTKRIPSRRESE